MIRLDSIVKYFHKGSVNEVFALNDISLEIEEGAVVDGLSGSSVDFRIDIDVVGRILGTNVPVFVPVDGRK